MEVDDTMQWFRWWHEGTTDGKLLRLTPTQRWIWIAILTLASESPKRGSLYVSEKMPADVRDVARKADEPVGVVITAIETMMSEGFDMLHRDEKGAWVVKNWEKYQPKREDATNAERQERYRAKQRALGNALRNGESNAPDTDADKNTSSSLPFERNTSFDEETVEYQLAYHLRSEILRNLPNARVPKPTPEAMAKWSESVGKILRIDKRKPDDVKWLMTWCQNDEFWRSNILSPEKLRKQWDRLWLRSNGANRPKSSTKPVPFEDDVTRRLRELERERGEHVQ